jgi:dephospho-CoA kinase
VQSAMGGAAVVVLDIPLLFEKGLEDSVDAVLVVSCAEAVQRQRALARLGMTESKLQSILDRQVRFSIR